MAAPVITIVDSNDRTVTSWDNGVIQAANESSVLTFTVWNNRGGTVDMPDLKEATIVALDIDGKATSELVVNKWTRVNVPILDGSPNIWTPIGGTTGKYIRADGLTAADGYVIKGNINDGTLANSNANYCTISIKTKVPEGASAGVRNWKLRINGYYT